MGFRDRITNGLSGFLKSGEVQKSIYNNDPERPKPEPRKGLFAFMNSMVQKKQLKPFVLNAETLERLAKTDPVTWAIVRTIKSRVNNRPWDIVPDTEKMEKELDRWEEYVIETLNPYGLKDEPFKSSSLDCDLFDDIATKIDEVRADITKTDEVKIKAVRWLFKAVKRRIIHDAQAHCEEVRAIFEKPNCSAETSLRALQELVINDLLIFDSGVIVKNYSRLGKLAEMYTVPGYQIKIYRNEDKTTPQPPEPAYIWEDNGIARAEFTNAELLYIMQNPTHTGYGVSPLEVAAYIITASLFADQYSIDYFKNSNVPPGVFNLGEKVTEEQRRLFQSLWDNEVQGRAGGLHKMLFMAGAGNDAKFIPLQNLSNRDMQMMEYLKWTVAIKCACYGLSPQDIGFTSDFQGLGGGGVANVQAGLSESRGIQTILNLLEQYYNAEIVKSEFSYTDVKFEWQNEKSNEDVTESNADIADINAGVMSRNERRNKKGLKPVPGGDKLTITTGSGLVPVDKLDGLGDDSMQESIAQEGSQETPEGMFGAPQEEQEQTPQDGKETSQGNPFAQEPETTKREVVRRPVLKVSVNKRSRGLDKKLGDTVKKLRDSGIDAELRIGFEQSGDLK